MDSASTNFSTVMTEELSTLTLSKSSSLSSTILVLPELVPFDQIPALQLLLGFGILRDHADAVAGVGIDEIEPDRGPVVTRVVQRHGAGHEREPEVTAPDGPLCHQAAFSG